MSKVICPNGLSFNNTSLMCKHYGVNYATYLSRLKLGWTKSQSLGITPRKDKVICPNGLIFKTFSSMCEHYGLNLNVYRKRLNLGWTLRQALGIDSEPIGNNFVTCPNGLIFKSKKQMCDYYNETETTYQSRLRRGWTERQALGIDPPKYSVTCPNGKTFKNKTSLLEYYDVDYKVYTQRLERGWTESQALGIEPSPDSKYVITCPKGIPFKNIPSMCEYYGVLHNTYKTRRNIKKWTMRQALGIDPPPNGIGKRFVDSVVHSWNNKLTILQKENAINEIQFYLAQDKETLKNYVLTEEQIKTYPACIQKFTKVKD